MAQKHFYTILEKKKEKNYGWEIDILIILHFLYIFNTFIQYNRNEN